MIKRHKKDFRKDFKLRLGAQSVSLLNTLRDPTQLRRRQCATRQGQQWATKKGVLLSSCPLTSS